MRSYRKSVADWREKFDEAKFIVGLIRADLRDDK
jgi:hypothetical protein